MTEIAFIDALELRSHPELLQELRAEPGRHRERRVVALKSAEMRANEAGGFKVGGLAAVFDELSLNLGGFREQIDRGAFRKVLAGDPDVRCLFNHDPNRLLGRTTNGTLRLKEVAKGLDYEADAAPTSYAADLKVLLEREDVNQSSFAFRVARGGDSWDEDDETGALIRTIHEFSDLYDVSPVTDPAYPQTDSGLRTILDEDATEQDVRDLAAKIHRGDLEVTAAERALVDGALEKFSTVSPWTAERAARAFAQEPELAKAAAPGMRVSVEMEPVQGEVDNVLLAARRRGLRIRERTARK